MEGLTSEWSCAPIVFVSVYLERERVQDADAESRVQSAECRVCVVCSVLCVVGGLMICVEEKLTVCWTFPRGMHAIRS